MIVFCAYPCICHSRCFSVNPQDSVFHLSFLFFLKVFIDHFLQCKSASSSFYLLFIWKCLYLGFSFKRYFLSIWILFDRFLCLSPLLKIPFHCHPASTVPDEKTAITFYPVPLYVMCLFYSRCFSGTSLPLPLSLPFFSNLTIICLGVVFFHLCCLRFAEYHGFYLCYF